MTSPQTDIESALAYASHDKEGLVVSRQYHLDQKNEHFEKLLSEVKSIDDLLVLQERLETDLPWFKLASDESVRDYFSRWKVRIENHSDLELFAAALSQRIADLAVSDSTAQKYQEEKRYRLQLRNLPTALSQFKQTQHSFDSLAGPFDALLRYVYQAVTEQGFSMNEDGATALEKYLGTIRIIPGVQLDYYINEKNHPYSIYNFLFYPLYQEQEVTAETRTWYGKKRLVTTTKRTSQIKMMIIRPEQIIVGSSQVRWLSQRKYTAQEFLQKAKDCILEEPRTLLQPYRTLLQTLFNLPKYMHNYIIKLNQELKDIIDNLPNGE